MKLIGFSLTKCVTDLVLDKTSVGDVVVIYSGIELSAQTSLDEIIDRNKHGYWRKLNQTRLAEVLWELSDKIILLRQHNVPVPRVDGRHWAVVIDHELVPIISNAELAAHANNYNIKAPTLVQRLAELLLIERGINPIDVEYEIDNYHNSGKIAIAKGNVFVRWKE